MGEPSLISRKHCANSSRRGENEQTASAPLASCTVQHPFAPSHLIFAAGCADATLWSSLMAQFLMIIRRQVCQTRDGLVFTDGLKITDGLIIMLPVIEEFERRQAKSETVFVLLYAIVSVPMGCFFLVHAHWACREQWSWPFHEMGAANFTRRVRVGVAFGHFCTAASILSSACSTASLVREGSEEQEKIGRGSRRSSFLHGLSLACALLVLSSSQYRYPLRTWAMCLLVGRAFRSVLRKLGRRVLLRVFASDALTLSSFEGNGCVVSSVLECQSRLAPDNSSAALHLFCLAPTTSSAGPHSLPVVHALCLRVHAPPSCERDTLSTEPIHVWAIAAGGSAHHPSNPGTNRRAQNSQVSLPQCVKSVTRGPRGITTTHRCQSPVSQTPRSPRSLARSRAKSDAGVLAPTNCQPPHVVRRQCVRIGGCRMLALIS